MTDTITITGNIAADPERRHTPNGTSLTTFRVGSSQRHFDRGKGEWVQTSTNWYQVSAFRGLADHAFASLHKGDRVIVTGRLRLREWENESKRGLSVEIDADGIGHDLRWGTTDYRSAATGDQEQWAVPMASNGSSPDGGAPTATEAAGGHGWPTATPPAPEGTDQQGAVPVGAGEQPF